MMQEQWVKKILWLIFCIYCAAIVLSVINHEPWGDEAQPWLLIRDNDLRGLLSLLPAEGHPPLWYLLLFPFVKLGLPYTLISWIPGLVSIAAVFILLFRTRFPLILKLVMPFSNFFFYIYSVFARSYSLILLLSMLIVALYPKRFEKPWLFAICIICLFNTHMLVFAFAFTITILFLVDAIADKKINGQIITCFILMLLGGLYLIPYLGNSEMSQYFGSRASADHIGSIQKIITGGLLIFGDATFALALFCAVTICLIKRTKPLLILLASSAGMFYILAYHYSTGITRHYGVLYILILATYGIAEYYKKDKLNSFNNLKLDWPKYGVWVCALIAVLQMPVGFKNYQYDIEGQYSGAKEAAKFIKDNNLEHKTIVAYQSWAAIAVLPYLSKDVQFYNPECDRWETYFNYDSCFTKEFKYAADYTVKIGYMRFKNNLDDVVFLFNFPLKPYIARYMDLLYTAEEEPVYSSENFYIYKFKKGLR